MMAIKRSLLAFSIALAAAVTGASLWTPRVAQAYPEPSILPVSWQLDVKTTPPARMYLTDAQGQQKAYWYIRYTVTNNTGKDILFTPVFELITDTGQSVTGNKDVPDALFAKIKDLYHAKYLTDPLMIFGKLLQGEDNAKDGVAMFANVDPNARVYHIFISGLAGETADVTDPMTKKTVTLHKTLELTYQIPGEAIDMNPHPQLVSKRWVMK